jgi:hypothetical protein
LPLSQRYRFHMYQDAGGQFTHCSFISDDYSLSLNSFPYQIRELDLAQGRVEFNWQGVPWPTTRKS